jgi:predicted GNAT family acetyltransferase
MAIDASAVRHDPARHCFECHLDGACGVLHYRYAPDGRLVLPSVVVDPAIEGRGVAGALTRAALDWARAEGLAVAPVCPYVIAWLRRHPGYADLAG